MMDIMSHAKEEETEVCWSQLIPTSESQLWNFQDFCELIVIHRRIKEAQIDNAINNAVKQDILKTKVINIFEVFILIITL